MSIISHMKRLRNKDGCIGRRNCRRTRRRRKIEEDMHGSGCTLERKPDSIRGKRAQAASGKTTCRILNRRRRHWKVSACRTSVQWNLIYHHIPKPRRSNQHLYIANSIPKYIMMRYPVLALKYKNADSDIAGDIESRYHADGTSV